MSWELLAERQVACSVENFYSSVNVWLKRPNVVNKRLLGAVEVTSVEEICLSTSSPSKDGEDDEVRGRQLLRTMALLYDKETRESDSVDKASENGLGGRSAFVKLKGTLRQLLPKMRSSPKGWEAVLIDETNCSVVFCPVLNLDLPQSLPPTSYKIHFAGQGGDSSSLRISLFVRRRTLTSDMHQDPSDAPPACAGSANGITAPTHDWLSSVLLPKLAQWCEENSQQLSTAEAGGMLRKSRRGESLIPLGRYSQLYGELKEKYGPTLVKNWPEGTDPHKFVYEDIAIATYLLVLWESERHQLGSQQKQSFIDLGCGNGLLVYLLTSEGHPGKGIDLRERKIWTMYQGKAHLEVCSLEPSETTTFPDFDWLIGNHSDELTPWIPVMASRSSFTTRYFVLPCCAHDFNKKFSRPTTRQSQYQCYLDYVREIGEKMGYVVKEDTLRIPSSKRVCQVGMMRSYPISEESRIDQSRREFLIERCGSGLNHGHAHKDLAQCEHGDLDGPCDQQATTGKTKYAKNVVNTKTERCHQQCTDNCTPELPPRSPGMKFHCGPEELRGKEDSPQGNSDSVDGSLLFTGFTPRDPKEVVRNCSHVNRKVTKVIVDTLTRQLLQTENYITLVHFQDDCVSSRVAVRPSLPVSPLSPQPHRQGEVPADVNANGKDSHAIGTDTETETELKPCTHHRQDDCDYSEVVEVVRVVREEERRECAHMDSSCTIAGYGDSVCRCGGEGVRGVEERQEDVKVSVKKDDGGGEEDRWNLGGKIHLSEAAAMFDSEVLAQLKSECGGLQTLLRNEHQIFKVSGGYVSLRNWSQLNHPPRKSTDHLSRNQKKAKDLLYKTKLCWFHSSHPQGCPRRSQDCPYAHGELDLRERPNFKDILDCSKELLLLT